MTKLFKCDGCQEIQNGESANVWIRHNTGGDRKVTTGDLCPTCFVGIRISTPDGYKSPVFITQPAKDRRRD